MWHVDATAWVVTNNTTQTYVQGNPAKPTEKINISLLTIPLIKNIHLLAGPL